MANITDKASDTNLGDTFIPEIWSQQTRDTTEANLVMWNLIDRSFESELKGGPGDVIHIQGVDDFNAADTGTVATDKGTLTVTEGQYLSQINLTIDTHAYKAFKVDYDFELQNNANQFMKLTGKAGYSVATKLDDDAAGLIDNFSQTVGTLAVGLTDQDILDGLLYLNDANAPESDRFFLVSAKQQLGFFSIDKYINSLYSQSVGSLGTNKFKGFFGSRYGLDWYMSTNVEGTNAAGHDNGIFHREAIAGVIQDDMRSVTQYMIEEDSTMFVVHVLYGLIEVRDNFGIWMKGE